MTPTETETLSKIYNAVQLVSVMVLIDTALMVGMAIFLWERRNDR